MRDLYDSETADMFENSVNGGILDKSILALLAEAVSLPAKILGAVLQVKNNEQDLVWLVEDALTLITTIYEWYQHSPNQAQQPAMVQIISQLSRLLEEVLFFVEEQVHTKRLILFIKRKVDARKVKKYRERLKDTADKFHNIFTITSFQSLSVPAELLKKQRQLAGSHPHLPTYEEADEVNRAEERR
ncbi:hypothetical protein D9613_004514 [Agrocybe pediades]|uniref:Uncharacterized protein n=1 Tax=Agrocybe pediades TaxID=84607 RepID=A0A8H4QJQ8_9AGAR|nr:hypothetical protein D9613_004514 [Agrocybe pediades]